MSDGRRADISIRHAEPADVACIAVLGTQVFLDTYAVEGVRPTLAREVLRDHSPEGVARRLAAPGAGVLLAERNRHLVGFAEFTRGVGHDLVAVDDAAELNRLYVQAPFVGRGVGTALLARAEAVVGAAGAAVLWLTAWAENRRALRFYERRGYALLGSSVFVFEEDRYETRILAKTLAPRDPPVRGHALAGR